MAGRVEVIIKCNTSGTYPISHTTTHGNMNINEKLDSMPLYQKNFTLFSIVVNSTNGTNGNVNPETLTFPPYTGYLEDTTNLTPGEYNTTYQCGHFPNASLITSIKWSVKPNPGSANCSEYRLNLTNAEALLTTYNLKFLDIIGKGFGINGQVFTGKNYLMRLVANRTYEFYIEFGPHPFHHHINPYQIQNDLSFGFIAQKGEWRDVVSNMEQYTVRTRTVDFVGKVIMHCHFLPHEDRGLMGYYMISANTSKCTSTNGVFLPVAPDSVCQQTRDSDFCFDTTTSDSNRNNIIPIFTFGLFLFVTMLC